MIAPPAAGANSFSLKESSSPPSYLPLPIELPPGTLAMAEQFWVIPSIRAMDRHGHLHNKKDSIWRLSLYKDRVGELFIILLLWTYSVLGRKLFWGQFWDNLAWANGETLRAGANAT